MKSVIKSYMYLILYFINDKWPLREIFFFTFIHLFVENLLKETSSIFKPEPFMFDSYLEKV